MGASGRVQSGRAHAGGRLARLRLRQGGLAGAAQLVVELTGRQTSGEEGGQRALLAMAEAPSG